MHLGHHVASGGKHKSSPQNSTITRQEKWIANYGSAKWGKIKELATKITTKCTHWPGHIHGATRDQKIFASPNTVYVG